MKFHVTACPSSMKPVACDKEQALYNKETSKYVSVTYRMNEVTEINFLDSHLKLIYGTYKPYIKPNCVLRYISSNSHSIKKRILLIISHVELRAYLLTRNAQNLYH